MEIKFSCKNCGQNIAADPVHAGIHALCPTCKNPVIVPAIEHTIKPQPAESVSPSREEWIKNEQVRQEKSNQNTSVAHPQVRRIKQKPAPVQAPKKTPVPPRPKASFPSFKLGGYANEAVDFGSLTLGHIIAVLVWLLLFALGAVYLALTKNILGGALLGAIRSIPIMFLMWALRASWIYIVGIEKFKTPVTSRQVRNAIGVILIITFGLYLWSRINYCTDILRKDRLLTEIHPNDSGYWFTLGLHYDMYYMPDSAEKAFKKTLELDRAPSMRKHDFEMLAKIYRKRGRSTEAEICDEEARKCAQIIRKSP